MLSAEAPQERAEAGREVARNYQEKHTVRDASDARVEDAGSPSRPGTSVALDAAQRASDQAGRIRDPAGGHTREAIQTMPRTTTMRPATIAVLCAALAACHDDDDDGGGAVAVLFEQEPNDDPLTANHFGVLRVGDRFFIDGAVRDDLVDPFDGFAFTAGEALHVDFQLFSGNPAADLDVCLYDPLLDQTLACYQTASDPEQGGVDVTAGGLDFHLVIESFVGQATYSLEIVVLPLFVREALGEDGAGRITATGASAECAADALEGYRKSAPAPRVLLEQSLEIDVEHGLVIERLHVRREDL
jgi:hypothetical protein